MPALGLEPSTKMPARQATLAPIHVLAVDDDPSLRQMIVDYLGDNDIEVTAIGSGSEIAPAMARATIDLVILDLKLPGEDGMQIARELRAESDIPIIMLTGRKDEADRVMGLELGADDYLTKPFSPRELLARIRALLRRSRAQESVADGLDPNQGISLRGMGAQRAAAPIEIAAGRDRADDQQRVQPAGRFPGRAAACPFARAAARAFAACTTTRCTTARWMCRSDGCAGRSSPRTIARS